MKRKLIFFVPSLGLFALAAWFAVSLLPQPPYISLTNEDLQKMLEQDALIIDIRRPDEWRQTGVIEGSTLITAFDERGRMTQEFPALFGQVTDSAQPVILICRTGNRTDVLSRLLMEELGYEKVYNVSNGIVSWIGDGGKVQPCLNRGPDLRC